MNQHIRFVTAKQMQHIDRRASAVFGVPSIVLMENAGRGAAEEILTALKKIHHPRVIILCGTGNNGGDGFVTARHLMIHSIQSEVFILGQEAQIKGDARVNFNILKKMKCPARFARPSAEVLKQADCVVDAMFGIGLNREITGLVRSVIEDINRYARKVTALDIPSGLDASTGKIHGVCVKADKTITFHLPKTGMARGSGPEYTGKVIVRNIGIGG